VRSWLHLHDADPDVGRLAARHPPEFRDPVDVLAFPLPGGVDRQGAKASLIAGLHEARLLSPEYVGDPPGTAPSGGTAPELVSWMVASIAAHRPAI